MELHDESGETDGGQVVYIYVIIVIMWPQDKLIGRGACLARMPLYMHVVVVVEDRCDLNKWVVLGGSKVGRDGFKISLWS